MSIRQMFLGSIVKPGFNPLAAQTPSYTYNLLSWGQGSKGALGLGNTTYYSSPVQVGSLTDWLVLSSAQYSSYGIKTNGTLWSWGQNYNAGQLGLGNTTDYSSPKQVGALTAWSQVVGLQYGAYALKTDGTMWSWGANGLGQLGIGNTTDYSSPKQIGALTTWAYIGAPVFNAFAIKTDGTLWAWGYGLSGQLGLGNTTAYSSPKQVGSLTNWSSITGASTSAIATKTDGTMWTWGSNAQGQLGLGNTTDYSSPKQVGALTNWYKVNGGNSSFFATKTDGTLWAWGNNGSGRLGLGNITNYSSPKQVGTLTTWKEARMGRNGNSSFGLKTDGTLWAWGVNGSGQLGLNNATNYSSPVQVGSLATWFQVAPGLNSTIALKY